MPKEDHTIVIVENYWEGYLHSIAWFGALVAMIIFAVYIESSAMQWIMGIMWFLAMITWVVNLNKKIRMTLDEAAAKIEELKKEK